MRTLTRMQQPTIVDRLAELYPAVYRRLHARRERGARAPSPEALAVMTHMEAAGPLTVSEAARHFGRAQSATSELVNRLQARAWVSRMRDPQDKRRVLVWLTETGFAELKRSREVLDRGLLVRTLAVMTGAEQRQLLHGLEALVAAADRALATPVKAKRMRV